MLPVEHNLGGVGTAVQHHGKELSYNNYLDADAAYSTGQWGCCKASAEQGFAAELLQCCCNNCLDADAACCTGARGLPASAPAAV